ncbi:MAG TPA: hypothetical protein VHB70_03400 [Parafilimonas sp.]|nr:hypothetical protein [Parafilimonas sp.]
MNDNTQRFSNRVDNYVKYRPSYPTEIISFLQVEIGFNKDFIVADVGSGTGIFSEIFYKMEMLFLLLNRMYRCAKKLNNY